MSRLFEALSDEEIKRGLLKIVPRAAASPSAVQPAAIAGSAIPNESTQPVELVQALSASVPEVVALPETVSQGMISPDVALPVPPEKEEIEKENPLLQEPPLNFVSPDVGPLGTAVVGSAPPESTQVVKQLAEVPAMQANILDARSVQVKISPDSRLVAFAGPNSLGAEKFRALVTRLDHLRRQREMKSIQVTSSVISEGKTLVAGNLAVTLAKYSGAKTLLVEGDLHRPSLAALFGLSELPGLSHWWAGSDPEPPPSVCKLDGMPLWILTAGKPSDRPADILSSVRFAKAFTQLAGHFDWIVVDSTPMLPIVDANLWSRLVDGTLLVVREGMAPVKALKKGLQALDSPKLIGVVINDVSGPDHVGYHDQYYSAVKSATGPREKT
jgi:capsular exopolysaccharide synthesis family protein